MKVSSKFVFSLFLFIANIILISLINSMSVFYYLYFSVLSFLAYRFLIGRNISEPLSLYSFYSFLIVVLYLLQLSSYPEYFGFSGGLGTGTDDARYYSQVAASLPSGFPVMIGWPYPYARVMLAITWWYPIQHPLDILFFNAIPLMLIPPLTQRLAVILSGQDKVGKTAYKLVAICPFLLANSLILIRDGWVAMASIGAILLFLKGRYLKMGMLISLLYYLRIGSALLLMFVLGFFLLLKLFKVKGSFGKFFYIVSILLVVGAAAAMLYPRVVSYLQGRHVFEGSTFFREEYIDFLGQSVQASETSDSLRLVILQQHPLIRIPLNLAYYFMSPMFVPQGFWSRGIFKPRAVLLGAFALLFIVYLKYFIQAVFSAWRKRNFPMKVVLIAYLGAILILSQISMQIRHKTMLMPLLYVIVAYGYHHRPRLGQLTGNTASAISALTQIGRAIVR